MNYLKFSLLIFCIFRINSIASQDANIHELCLKTADFEGCMNTLKGTNSVNDIQAAQDKCSPSYEGWCIAGKGKDSLDKNKIKGWYYRESPDKRFSYYFDPNVKKLKVNGNYGRYLVTNSISRLFREYKPTIPGREIVVGETKTRCTNFGFGTTNLSKNPYSNNYSGTNNFNNNINCVTEAPSTITTPTEYGNPEGVVEWSSRVIIDCKLFQEADVSNIKFPKSLGKWTDLIGIYKNKYCYDGGSLGESDISDYANTDIR